MIAVKNMFWEKAAEFQKQAAENKRKVTTANIRKEAVEIEERINKEAIESKAKLLIEEAQVAPAPPPAPEPAQVKSEKPLPVPVSIREQKRKYKALVWRLTDAQDLSGLPGIKLRKWRKYDLDHIISIHDGFKKGLPAKAIASLDNLRIIPHKENANKGSKSHYAAHPLAGLLIPQ